MSQLSAFCSGSLNNYLCHTDPARITSIEPNHPFAVLTSLVLLTYSVPVGSTEVVLTCNALGSRLLPPRVQWFRENITGGIVSPSHNAIMANNNYSYSSARLQFQNGFGRTDAGRYLCVVTDKHLGDSDREVAIVLSITNSSPSQPRSQSCQVARSRKTHLHFQIRVFGLSCAQRKEESVENITREFSEAVIAGISSHCLDSTCLTAETSSVTVYAPTCSRLIAGAVVFRGTIIGAERSRAASMSICALSRWAQSGPLAHISGRYLLVDQNCNIFLNNLRANGSECLVVSTNPLVSIIASTSGILILLLVLSISTAAVSILTCHKWYR
jgi:hypothetical protein